MCRSLRLFNTHFCNCNSQESVLAVADDTSTDDTSTDDTSTESDRVFRELMASLLFNFTDVWITLNASSGGTVFRLYNESGRIRLPPLSMEEEFFGNYDPRAPDPFDYGSTELPPACSSDPATLSIPQVFLMTARLRDFQMFDQLRHGIGTFERFFRAFPGARTPSVPILVLDTSQRALSTKRLAVLRPSQLGSGLALTLLAMGFDAEGFGQRIGWWSRRSQGVDGPDGDRLPSEGAGRRGAGRRGRTKGQDDDVAKGQRGGLRCVRVGSVVGGHKIFGLQSRETNGASPRRLRGFREAIGRTLRLRPDGRPGGEPPLADLALFLLRRHGPRQILNEHALNASGSGGLEALIARESGLTLTFARLETLSVVAQFALVSRARLLIGNHGAGLTWAAMLPSAPHHEHRCAVLELYANASADGLPVDYSHFSAASGVRYRPLAQETSPDCRGKRIRECGHIFVDVPSLIGAVSELGLRRGGRAQGQPATPQDAA